MNWVAAKPFVIPVLVALVSIVTSSGVTASLDHQKRAREIHALADTCAARQARIASHYQQQVDSLSHTLEVIRIREEVRHERLTARHSNTNTTRAYTRTDCDCPKARASWWSGGVGPVMGFAAGVLVGHSWEREAADVVVTQGVTVVTGGKHRGGDRVKKKGKGKKGC